MKFGIGISPTAYAVSPVELARAAEDAGFESLWFPEHSHIPLSEPAFPGGAEVPKMYKHSLDPFVTIGAVAAATERLLLGTGICLVIERDPIVTAKEVATADVLSGGRVLFGVGGGWNRVEMANHGTNPKTRFALMAERIAAMKTIWAEDEPEFHGRFVDFDPIWCWPKPVQQPHPPIIVGGNGPGTLRRVVEWGDGWMPNAGSPDRFAPRLEELRRMSGDAGRAEIPVTMFGCKPEAKAVGRYADLGVDRVVFWVPADDRDTALRELDRFAGVMAECVSAGG